MQNSTRFEVKHIENYCVWLKWLRISWRFIFVLWFFSFLVFFSDCCFRSFPNHFKNSNVEWGTVMWCIIYAFVKDQCQDIGYLSRTPSWRMRLFRATKRKKASKRVTKVSGSQPMTQKLTWSSHLNLEKPTKEEVNYKQEGLGGILGGSENVVK